MRTKSKTSPADISKVRLSRSKTISNGLLYILLAHRNCVKLPPIFQSRLVSCGAVCLSVRCPRQLIKFALYFFCCSSQIDIIICKNAKELVYINFNRSFELCLENLISNYWISRVLFATIIFYAQGYPAQSPLAEGRAFCVSTNSLVDQNISKAHWLISSTYCPWLTFFREV